MKIARIALSLITLQLTISISKAFGQNEEFELIPDSQIVHLHLDFGGDHLGVRISKLPKQVIGSILSVHNISNTCYGGAEIVGRQFSLELKGDYRRADTLIISIISREDRRLQYPPELYIRNSMNSLIIIGADCYRLNCVPRHNPWMPTAYDPFLFPKNGYFLNPQNGNIKKGRRLINSGYYDACDLKLWIYISPYGSYYDKNGIKHRGSDIITNGKIKLSDWNMDTFR